jgi:aryl carrier-like protein
LGSSGNIQPLGIPGELCISGDGLARGYLNRAELTAEKFVENPFKSGETMYRTGDVARWLPDGNIEFLGRLDHQVKVRGFRIELGEIESRLLKHPQIKETVVVAKEDPQGSKYLCAYFVNKGEVTSTGLREHLAKELPDYMIPSYFIPMEKLPLTSNGKINRQALPEPDGSIHTGVEYVAPENQREEALVKSWQQALKVDRIGTRDNFFSLGGDSIKAIQVLARLNNYGFKLEIKELFKHPTIKELSNYVKSTTRQIEQGIVQGESMEVI